MSSLITKELRLSVAVRADYLCEYCLMHEDDMYFGCEVDHIISLKHGGQSTVNNLAYACVFCNRHKGSDIGSILWRSGNLVRFFNPRTDHWGDHFKLDGADIKPESDIGEVTVQIFNFNHVERILEREVLMSIGRYPIKQALSRMMK